MSDKPHEADPHSAEPVAYDLRKLVPGFRLDWSGLRNRLEDFAVCFEHLSAYELRSSHLDEMARRFEDAILAALLAANQRADAERQAREAAERMSAAHREHAQTAVEHSASLNRLLSIAEASADAAEARYKQQRDLRASNTDLLRREIDKARADRGAAEARANSLAAKLAEAKVALNELVNRDCRYFGPVAHLPFDTHGHAIGAVSRARLALSNIDKEP